MSICTSCHQGRLTPTPLGQGLSAYVCDACQGVAIDMQTYLAWRAQQPRIIATPAQPPGSEGRSQLQHNTQAVHCPGCKRLMSKHFVHAGNSPALHTCLRCDVIWLPPGVWPYLVTTGLHTSITTITTAVWQNRRRYFNVQLQLSAEDRAALGDAVYRQALQIDAWLNAQPKRKQILKMLNRLDQAKSNQASTPVVPPVNAKSQPHTG